MRLHRNGDLRILLVGNRILLLDFPIQNKYLSNGAVVFHNEIDGIVLVLHAGESYRADIEYLLRQVLLLLLSLRDQFLLQVPLSQQVGIHAFVHYQFDHVLGILLRVFLEIRNDVGKHKGVRAFDLLVVENHVNYLRILPFNGQIDGGPVLLRLDLDVQLIWMKFQQVLGYFIVPVLE